ncbi:MAG: antibiotic biosynthesis monooxygenase [Bacteroidota bacterium]|nr:antibiotic biosynthesis monooxygenase [Bacteroidota bacterium]
MLTYQPPYYAVIFTSIRKDNEEGYNEMSELMDTLAKQQEGFLDMESARNELGITVSYWTTLEAIAKWKMNLDHLEAQRKGISTWYQSYKVRICKVEREYHFNK